VDDGKCFICGPENRSGLQIKFDRNSDLKEASARIVIPETYQGWQGIIHGGISAAILDDAMAHASFAAGHICVTGELTVRYKNPVPAEKEIEISAVVKDIKRSIVFTEATITCEGKIAVTAKAKMFITS